MLILWKVTLSDLFEYVKVRDDGLPLLHFRFKLLFYLDFLVEMLQVLRAALHAEELLLTVWTGFNVAVVDLHGVTPAVARDVRGGCPGIKRR